MSSTGSCSHCDAERLMEALTKRLAKYRLELNLAFDTTRESPSDILEPGEEELLEPREAYRMQPRSLAVLISR